MPKSGKRDYIAVERLSGPKRGKTHTVTPATNPFGVSKGNAAKPADAVRRIAEGGGRTRRGV